MGLRLMVREGGTLNIADGLIHIDFVKCSDGRTSILVDAPKDIRVLRQELVEREIASAAITAYRSGELTLDGAREMIRSIRGITFPRIDAYFGQLERLTSAKLTNNNSEAS